MHLSTKMPLIVLSLLYCGLSIFLFNEFGVKIVNDSHRYLDYASNLENGFYFDKHNFWYFGYVLFIFIVQLIYKDPLAVIVAQYLLGFIATLALYKTSLLLFQDTRTAIITALSYMLFIEISCWNSYILCESVYCSLTCISLYFLASTQRQSQRFYKYIPAVLIVAITILTKPTGIALLGAILTIALLKLWSHAKSTVVRIAFVFILSTGFILVINKMLFTYLIIENYQSGEIIYDITTLPYQEIYNPLIITPPENIYIPSQNNPPLVRIVMFIVHNPLYFLQLFRTKLFFFLFHIRPYWSWMHNAFVLFFLLPYYYYVLLVFKKQSLPKEIMVFSAVYLFIHSVSIALTSVDWDGRFLMPLLPLIFMLGASEISADYKKLQLILMRAAKPKS